ncbi:hypothetical protein F53441_6761 [Fusarium austroafricanum]|uniref:Uncharacterized protein n=1 Tax=Fusarium austroafricanum TaxID=2364996 RepID=A0A8H4KHT7_9HYPO|nr:hypothetical protein F53441_6761 [Fusarium austroafricanum]
MPETDVLIIGAGLSGIGLGVQLVRQLRTRNFEIIEKDSAIAGTWRANNYPGCGCDVPSHFYSYSFALNPNWSQAFAMQPEIEAYVNDVAKKWNIEKHVRFNSVVESARWDETFGMWEVTIRDVKTAEVISRRTKILISAVGALSTPKECDIPGAATFQGRMFHTAKWDHSFNWKDEDVVIIGNGCSATQVLPAISFGDKAVKRVTQFARQAHWLSERRNPTYSPTFKWVMKWIPFAMRIYRARLYYFKEKDFAGFSVTKGLRIRDRWTKETTDYISKMAPARYLDFLIPKTEVGCKRRVNDTDYLASLHRDNVELIYDDPIQRIEENGVRTTSGRFISADGIILAHGFETQKPLFPMKIHGEDGITITEHWDQVSEGAASSYFGTCLSQFPNFFMMMGPNTLSGHLSVIYTSECQINYIMKVIRPILSGRADIVQVTRKAEKKDMEKVQEKARNLVWATGCTSWFIHDKTNRNTIMFPDWQFKFWLRSVFVAWKDLEYRNVSTNSPVKTSRVSWSRPFFVVAGLLGLGSIYLRSW